MGTCSLKSKTIDDKVNLEYIKQNYQILSMKSFVEFLILVTKVNRRDVINLFIENQERRNYIYDCCFFYACKFETVDNVRLIIDTYKINTHYQDENLLFTTIKWSENLDMIRYFIEDCHANVSVRDNSIYDLPLLVHAYDRKELTDYGAFFYLLKYGANVYAQDYLCLKKICRDNNVYIMRILIKDYNIDIHVDNDILMMESIESKNLEMVKLLVEHGVNLKLRKDLVLKLAHETKNIKLINYIDYQVNSSM